MIALLASFLHILNGNSIIHFHSVSARVVDDLLLPIIKSLKKLDNCTTQGWGRELVEDHQPYTAEPKNVNFTYSI